MAEYSVNLGNNAEPMSEGRTEWALRAAKLVSLEFGQLKSQHFSLNSISFDEYIEMALANVLSRKAGTATTSRPVPFTSRVCVAAKARVTCAIPSSSRQIQHIVCQAAAAEVVDKPQKVHPSPLSIAPPATYAIVEIGGTQMFVEPGKWYTCNRLKADVGSKIVFGRVLALKHDGKLTVGKPYLSNVNVEAEVIEELRGPKIIVYKMRPKKHYRRKQGHRQELSKFMVTKIEAQ